MSQERRKAERLEIFLIVDIKPSGVASNYFLGLTKSISAEGFSFESQNYDMKPGEILEFEIKDPEGELNIHAAGKIAWKKVTDFECLIGVKFHGLDEKSRNRIAALVSGNKTAHEELPAHLEDTVKAANQEADEQEEEYKEEVIAESISKISDMIASQDAANSGLNATDNSPVLDREMSPAETVASILKASANKSIIGKDLDQRDEKSWFDVRPEAPADASVPERQEVWEGGEEAVRKSRKYIIAALTVVAIISALVLLKPGTGKKDFESSSTPPSFTALNEKESGVSDKEPFSEIAPELPEMPGSGMPETELNNDIVETERENIALSEQVPDETNTLMESDAERSLSADEQKITVSQAPSVKSVSAQSSSKVVEAKENKQKIVEEGSKLTAKKEVAQTAPAVSEAEANIGGNQKQPASNRKSVTKKDKPAAPVKETPLSAKKVAAPQPEAPEEKPTPATENQLESSILFSENTTTADTADSYSESPFLQDSFASYEENFNDNANNWQIFDTDTAAAQIKDGEYYIENKRETESSLIFHYHDFPHHDDFTIETSIRMAKASGMYFYGMIFGGKDALDNYTFQIINNNSFSIIQHQNGVSKELAVGTVNNMSPTLHNMMRIAKQGDDMIFYINGKYLARVSNLHMFGNKIGFVVGGKSEISVDSTHSRIKI